MLEAIRSASGRVVTGIVETIDCGSGFTLRIATSEGPVNLDAEKIVNAAGPFAGVVANMLDFELPLKTSFSKSLLSKTRQVRSRAE